MSPERLASFAVLLRELRRVAGLTQEELARAAGVGVRTLRDLERGRAARPQRSTVELLANALALQGAAREAFVAAARSGRAAPVRRIGIRPRPTLIGRDAALRDLASVVHPGRLVTLVGLAGVGKTVLGLAVCHDIASRFGGGVGGVAVTDAATESEILTSMAATLGIARVDDVFGLVATSPVLIFVDGADRNPRAVVAALDRLRDAAAAQPTPQLAILATSRHPLGFPDEHLWPVAPLEVPPPAASEREVFDYPATALFLDRLRRVRSRPVGLDEASTLKALVRRLAGVPTAIELAASRGRVLELEEMLARIGRPSRRADPAGQVLWDAVEASWRVLTAAERECVCLLATFQWRWSLELAEEMLVARGVDAVALIDRLVSLGLCHVWPEPHELKFWLVEVVREFALEQAERTGRLTFAKDRHAAVMARVAAKADAELGGPQAAAAAARLDHLAADVQAAVDHVRGHDPQAAARLDARLARWRRLRGV